MGGHIVRREKTFDETRTKPIRWMVITLTIIIITITVWPYQCINKEGVHRRPAHTHTHRYDEIERKSICHSWRWPFHFFDNLSAKPHTLHSLRACEMMHAPPPPCPRRCLCDAANCVIFNRSTGRTTHFLIRMRTKNHYASKSCHTHTAHTRVTQRKTWHASREQNDEMNNEVKWRGRRRRSKWETNDLSAVLIEF